VAEKIFVLCMEVFWVTAWDLKILFVIWVYWLLWIVLLSYLWIVVVLLWKIIAFLLATVDRWFCHSDLWNKLSTQNIYYTCFWNMVDSNNSILLRCDAAALDYQIPLLQRDVLPFFLSWLTTQVLITSWCIVMSQKNSPQLHCCENLKFHMMDTALILEILCSDILRLLQTANRFYNIWPFKW